MWKVLGVQLLLSNSRVRAMRITDLRVQMVEARSNLLLNIDGRDAWINGEQKLFIINNGFVAIHDPREDYFKPVQIQGKTFYNVTDNEDIYLLWLLLRDMDFEKDLESKVNGIVRPEILRLAQEEIFDS